MRVDKEFVLREIAGDYIIIPTGKTVLEFNGLITVNEVGVSIWNMLQKEKLHLINWCKGSWTSTT